MVTDAIMICGSSGCFIYCNQFALNRLGYTLDEMLHLIPSDIVHPDYHTSSKADHERLWAGETVMAESAHRTKDGRIIPVELHARRTEYSGDSVIVAVVRDITERKRVAAAFNESEERYRTLVEASPTAILVMQEGRYMFANPAGASLLGYANPANLIGKLALDTIVPEYLPIIHKRLRSLEEGKPNSMIEIAVRRPDGSTVSVETTSIPITYEGKPAALIIGQDITTRKQFEMDLRRSESRLQSIIEMQTAYVIRTDMLGNYSYVNQAFFNQFCWAYTDINDLIGTSCMDTILPVDHQKVFETVMACIQEPGKPIQVIIRKPTQNGGFFWTLWEFVALTGADGTFTEVQCMGFDITELMQVREKLQVQENALQSAANAIVITDHSGMIEWTNPAFTTLTGYSFEEVRGKSPSILKSGVQNKAFYANMWNTIVSGAVWHGRLINRRKDGGFYTEEQTITPVRDMSGTITHFIAIKQDITEREQAEQIRLEQERLKASLKKEEEFNALVRKAVSALSHDVRTPLAVIETTRETLVNYFDHIDEAKRREKLEVIGRQLHFVFELLNDMTLTVKSGLSYSVFKPKVMNLLSLCQIVIGEVQQITGNDHHLSFVTDGRIQSAWIDETLVSRILLNLLSNAIKFSPTGGSVSLELGQREEWIVLRVIDHGLGISEADLPRIFEPFYRSDSVRAIGGTGLGLNIVKDCVDRHEGHIAVESQLGKGTTFTIELPLKREPVAEMQ